MLTPSRNPLRALLTAAVLTVAAAALAQPTHVLLVLDASGSMYLKLDDGQYRIAAAKDALAAFVSQLPDAADLDVGLRVYGSRLVAVEEGACQDSELLLSVPGFDREALLRAIRDTQAKGATPIAYSLELAAEDLRGLPGRKVIVLVTDGAESCRGDLRGVVERLTAAGIDVDLRIIGFALSDAAIRSFEGLGSFENATSASQLAAALGRAVDLAPVAAAYRVTVALTRDGAPAVDGATVRFVDAVGGTAFDFTAGADGVFAAEVAAGSYRAELADAFSDRPLVVGGLAVTPDGANAFAFELAPTTEVAITVAPTDPVAGSAVQARYEGAPGGERGWLAIAPADAGDDVSLAWAYAQGAAGEVALRVPDEPGAFEVRYHLALPEGGSRVIGRSPAFTSRAATATLDAPAEVGGGAAFEVAWSGPDNQGDFLTIVPAGAEEGAFRDYAYTAEGSPARLTAPQEAGAYELRYVTAQVGSTLARRAIAVVAATASLTAPAQVPAGAAFEVAWSGPDNEGDYVTIVPVGTAEGEYGSYANTAHGSPATLTAPIDAGAYEVRYVAGQDQSTVASARVAVTAVGATVTAAARVGAGAAFEVAWTGPDNPGDYLTIVPAGAEEGEYLDYAYTAGGSPITLTAPDEPGRYEVRYVSGQGDRTLASAPVEVR